MKKFNPGDIVRISSSDYKTIYGKIGVFYKYTFLDNSICAVFIPDMPYDGGILFKDDSLLNLCHIVMRDQIEAVGD